MSVDYTSPTHPIVVAQKHEPHLLLRVIWFIFVGWWLSGILNTIGWFLNITVVGLPLGLYILNRIPQAATLKAASQEVRVKMDEGAGVLSYEVRNGPQRPFIVRAVYFVFVGWWLSWIWLSTAWILGISIIGLPLSFWMYGAVGKVTTLKR